MTLITTVFLPLTFVTGFFGQNFGWLVGHINGFVAFAVLGIRGLALSCAALLVAFRRAGYISG